MNTDIYQNTNDLNIISTRWQRKSQTILLKLTSINIPVDVDGVIHEKINI